MKAIPTSVKAQFFAMYLGQKAIHTGTGKPMRGIPKQASISFDNIERLLFSTQRSVLLRYVSDLTDEEAINFIKIQYGIFDATGCEFTVGRNQLGKAKIQVHVHKDNKHYHSFEISVGLLHQQGIDYLRSIGILIPFTYLNEDKKPVTLSVDELIGMKWAIVKK